MAEAFVGEHSASNASSFESDLKPSTPTTSARDTVNNSSSPCSIYADEKMEEDTSSEVDEDGSDSDGGSSCLAWLEPEVECLLSAVVLESLWGQEEQEEEF
ncbi:hypothetical protein GPECTOR_2g1008 [Gonium pectorale]|uniref:Uncharacterized protein n=1 Tax=Gonium pectorale TaxID=33097 RepID=A0A150H020_GONPE|nr:hypothetical protein GPECTOR_2g1008 [Gonium pectorale]|eukprot:KXZ55459.1 hypothetical protein GPECTOR_2g1008 [Gonium pectorale]